VLAFLGTRLGAVHVREIRKSIDLTEDQVQSALKTLVRRGYVKRLGQIGEGRVKATTEGLAFLEAGKAITSGPKGPRVLADDNSSLRSRIWRALRLLHKGTVTEILELAARGCEGNAQSSAKDYLNALVRSGHCMRLSRPGEKTEWPNTVAPTRYCLCLDNGPQAPQWNKRQKRIYDPNIKKVFHVD
jgi:DNA-binding MarR family transcriptional regulator